MCSRRIKCRGGGAIVGFIDSLDILITNWHVIADADAIFVVFYDTTRLKASVIATAAQRYSVTSSDGDGKRPGDPVFLIGNRS